jgi:hypothetical protein
MDSTMNTILPSTIYWTGLSYGVSVSTSSTAILGRFYSPCQAVSLSTATGAQCGCGKFHMGIDALPLKTMPMGEVRQVVASAYKLVHGSPVVEIRWT